MLWNIFKGGKPAFAELLLAACFVELHYDVGVIGGEVGWGIVESQVAILADADEGDVNGMLHDDEAQPMAFNFGLRLAIDPVDSSGRHRQLTDEAFPEVLAKRSGVARRQTQVFIQMKDGDLVPGDEGIGEQGVEHRELGSTGGEDEVGGAIAFDGFAEDFGPFIGGLLAHLFNS